MQKAHLVSVIAESKRFPRINISTSTSYYREKLQPLGLTPGHCWNGPTLFDSDGNVSGCQDPQVIPASLFDANGVLYLNSPVFPPPNVSGQDKNITSTSNPMDVRDDVVRTDHTFNEEWTILGHYMHDSLTQANAMPFGSWGSASYNTITSTLSNPSYSSAIKLSGTINTNLLIEVSLNYDGNIFHGINSANSHLPSGWNLLPYLQRTRLWPALRSEECCQETQHWDRCLQLHKR